MSSLLIAKYLTDKPHNFAPQGCWERHVIWPSPCKWTTWPVPPKKDPSTIYQSLWKKKPQDPFVPMMACLDYIKYLVLRDSDHSYCLKSDELQFPFFGSGSTLPILPWPVTAVYNNITVSIWIQVHTKTQQMLQLKNKFTFTFTLFFGDWYSYLSD